MPRPCEVLLASVDGGNLRNAIPREAEAVVLVPEAQYDAFAEAIAAYEKTVCGEFDGIEDSISIRLPAASVPSGCCRRRRPCG